MRCRSLSLLLFLFLLFGHRLLRFGLLRRTSGRWRRMQGRTGLLDFGRAHRFRCPGHTRESHHGRDRRRTLNRGSGLFFGFLHLLRSGLLLLGQHRRRAAEKGDARHSGQTHAARHLGHSSTQFLPTPNLWVNLFLFFFLFLVFFVLFLIKLGIFLLSGGSNMLMLFHLLLFSQILLPFCCFTGARHVGLVAIIGLNTKV
jgi:hypothetical protein